MFLQGLYFAWNVTQSVQKLEAKQSVVIHSDHATHSRLINKLPGFAFND